MDDASRANLDREIDGLDHRLTLLRDSLKNLARGSDRRQVLRVKCRKEVEEAEKFINAVKEVRIHLHIM